MKRREIFIELTSLLDVILIMIFVLLSQAQTQTTAAIRASESDRELAGQLSQQLDDAQRDLDDAVRELAGTKEELAGAKEELADAREELEKAQQAEQEAERQLNSEKLVLENSVLLTISTDRDGTLRLEQSGRPQQRISYDWGDDTYARNRLHSELVNLLREAPPKTVFLVFQYDRNEIYKAEYDMIRGVLLDLKLEAGQQNVGLSILEMDTEEDLYGE